MKPSIQIIHSIDLLINMVDLVAMRYLFPFI